MQKYNFFFTHINNCCFFIILQLLVVGLKIIRIFASKNNWYDIRQDIENNSLWAVRYDGEDDNSLRKVFGQWNAPEWLWEFITENMSDLESYFKITDVDPAIYDTMDDSSELECLILDISPEADLDKLFRPLENNRTAEMMLGKEKERLWQRAEHASWLRLYAIKLEPGCYIITGGAIKLTRTMQEREHTLKELRKMEQVRNLLIEQGAIDADGFEDYLTEIQ